MTDEKSAESRHFRWLGTVAVGTVVAALALASLALLGYCAARQAARQGAVDAGSAHCRTLARVAGPEDLVEDRVNRRLLVSAVDRRAQPAEDGAIWQVPLHPPRARRSARRIVLSGRDGCSFRPQGIDLVAPSRPGGTALLYVINHHAPRDSHPESPCFESDDRPHLPSTESAQEVTSIEVFRVEEDRLVYLRRLASPRVLTHGNDLVATPAGDLWVTVPPTKPLALLGERFGWSYSSRLVHYECAGEAASCGGTWRRVTPPAIDGKRPTFVNGIAWRPTSEATAGELLVASTLGGGVFAYRLQADGLEAGRRIAPSVAGPDNLSWLDEERDVLLTTAHPNRARFLRHAADAAVASPSEAWALFLDRGDDAGLGGGQARNDGDAVRQFRDDGRRISAASTALCVGGALVLGQVFGDTVEACHPVAPSVCADRAATPGREEAR